MAGVVEGKLIGKGKKVSIVASRFNDFITARLIEGAMDALKRHGVDEKDVTIYRVPGAFEIPPVAKRIAQTKKTDGVIGLGAVIRGSTPHFDYVASEVSKGIALVSLEAPCPVIFGVLTTDTIEQAIERAGTKSGNKGFDAGMALLEMMDLYAQI
ncbi:MAG: 6,7-dimethyl-8-ribityllumazine synthase [Deltaproteobacteria bacterium ADurb.BinA179]|jgi:6,7-dimethyl-8-ribityllumazine synthase|nr:MAG: 6,7-dimethyl-8-ribityllumazine synthase [Deltaproteobacteria bacterium ADurb.BinA179]HNU74626.1 6,7-dimethyl-8-ribityllumazine synthase [Deltaproteobacteria bacterium]HOD71469.1 6,7-dimethyl-8-ribityllumazine synthase [Deltaproteobacteria bacterium]HOS27368.1 6,7-dimethyl-8-ribityllumazine synthase [Deltaproteobacteria bacterium]HPV29248.1 6,7-dimethyl-8-ribityllumazine synthase [Deltaproteobacteria bacterium]